MTLTLYHAGRGWGDRRGSKKGPEPPPQILDIKQVCFLTRTQSRFLSFVLDGVLGPLFITHQPDSVPFSEVPEAMYVVRLRGFGGSRFSSKSPSSVRDQY